MPSRSTCRCSPPMPRRACGRGAAFVVLAAGLGLWQLRLLRYASWLAALPLAVWAAGLRGNASLSGPVVRIAAVVVLSQATLEAGFGALLSPFRSGTAHSGA